MIYVYAVPLYCVTVWSGVLQYCTLSLTVEVQVGECYKRALPNAIALPVPLLMYRCELALYHTY